MTEGTAGVSPPQKPLALACGTFAFQELPLNQALVRIGELGFRFADLAMTYLPEWGHLQPVAVQQEPLVALELIERAEGDSGVKVIALNLLLEFASLSERGQFEACAKLARRARVPVVNVLAGNRDPLVETRRLKDFAAITAELGVQLCVETHTNSLAYDPSLAVRLVRDLDGVVGLTLDTGHLLSGGVEQARWEALLPHVRHVHVKDAGREPELYQVPWGQGALDLPRLVRGLARAGYAGAISVEYIGLRPGDRIHFPAEPEIGKARRAVLSAMTAT